MFRYILLILCLIMTSCAHTEELKPQDVLKVQMFSVIRISMPDEGRSCTAFYIGRNLFLTAAHCLGNDGHRSFYMIDQNDISIPGHVVKYDSRKDLALITTDLDFHGPPLAIWNDITDGLLPLGSPLLSMGFPGYFTEQFTFEYSYFTGEGHVGDKIKCIVCKSCVYAGESGGPMISLINGKVIGLIDSNVEQITPLDGDRHLHNTIGIGVSYKEINAFIKDQL